MPNTIELVTRYLPLLDEQYAREAKSSILDVRPEFIQQTRDAKKIKIARMRVDGLANYSRASGFTAGAADLAWDEYTFSQDRGRAIQLDELDNEETFGLAFGRLAGEFQRVRVVPEIDAYRFAQYYTHAAVKDTINLSGETVLAWLDEQDATMDDAEVPENDRIVFLDTTAYNSLINDPGIIKKLDVTGNNGIIDKRIYSYNGHILVKVPQRRFYTAITLYDGVTSGQTEGGFIKAVGANNLGVLMVQRDAVLQAAKRKIARIWAPTKELAAGTDGVNPTADAWKFDFRVYHDAWEFSNKVAGIAGAVLSGASITSVTLASTDLTISSHAATASLASLTEAQLHAVVVAVGGATGAVTWTTSNAAKATVSAGGVVELIEATTVGTPVRITATSIYDPTKSDYVDITITA